MNKVSGNLRGIAAEGESRWRRQLLCRNARGLRFERRLRASRCKKQQEKGRQIYCIARIHQTSFHSLKSRSYAEARLYELGCIRPNSNGSRRRRLISLASEYAIDRTLAFLCRRLAILVENLNAQLVELSVVHRRDAEQILMAKRSSDFVIHREKLLRRHGEKCVPSRHVGQDKQSPVRALEAQGAIGWRRGGFLLLIERAAQRAAERDRENHYVLHAQPLDERVPASRSRGIKSRSEEHQSLLAGEWRDPIENGRNGIEEVQLCHAEAVLDLSKRASEGRLVSGERKNCMRFLSVSDERHLIVGSQAVDKREG